MYAVLKTTERRTKLRANVNFRRKDWGNWYFPLSELTPSSENGEAGIGDTEARWTPFLKLQRNVEN